MSYQIQKPEWFDLENYKKSKNASFNDWYENIAIRVTIIALYNDDSSSVILRKVEAKYKKEFICSYKERYKPLSYYIPDPSEVVKPLSIRSLLVVFNIFNKIKRIYSDDTEKKIKTNVGAILYPEEIKKSIIEVDLMAPVEVLMDQFNTLIIKEKKERLIHVKKGVTEADIKKWSDLQFIAFLDLYIWMKLKNKENIKGIKEKIVNLLYPNGRINGKDIDKLNEAYRRLIRHLNRILEPNFIDCFAAQNKEIKGILSLRKK